MFMEVQLAMFLFNKSKIYGSAEDCAVAWFNELKDEYAPIPMWGALAALEVKREQEEAATSSMITSHKMTPTTLANQGFVGQAMVVVKGEKVSTEVWKINDITDTQAELTIHQYIGDNVPSNVVVGLDELVGLYEIYKELPDLVNCVMRS